MSPRLLLLALVCAASIPASAYPPAPFHRIYGIVRDASGSAISTGAGTIILSGAGNVEIIRCASGTNIGPGINYSLSVPMDSGASALLYTVSALRPLLPFTIRVVIGGVSYVPIEMTGAAWSIGEPSATTRIDLTLGIDSDGDGLPDQWEQGLIDGDTTGRLHSLADVNPNDDLDGDGLTNLQEYLAGTYALDRNDKMFLKIIGVTNGMARLQFLAIKGRTYQIKASEDLVTYTQEAFSIVPSGQNSAPFFRSDDLRTVDAYVPVGDKLQSFYRLEAQ